MKSNSLIYLKDIEITSNKIMISPPFRIKSFTLEAGEIHGIVGDTGSGKSILTYFLGNEISYNKGEISGECISTQKRNFLKEIFTETHNNFQKIEIIYQKDFIPSTLSVDQYIHLRLKTITNKTKHLEKIELVESYLERLKIKKNTIIDTLSLSHKTLLAIIVAYALSPLVLVIDAVFHKISDFDRSTLIEIITMQKEKNRSVLLLTRSFEKLINICDNISLFKHNNHYRTISTENKADLAIDLLSHNLYNKQSASVQSPSEDFQNILTLNKNILFDLPIHILYVINKTDIYLMNNTAKKFYGKRSTQYPIPLTDIFEDETIKLINDAKEQSPEKYHIECFSVKYGGQDNYFTLVGFPIKSDDLSFTLENNGEILVIQDITEQEKIRNQLNISEKQFSVGILAAGVAHEINNPLEILMNNLDFMLLDPAQDERDIVINEMKTSIKDIHKIINQLINFTNETDEFSEFISIDVNQILSRLIHFIDYSAEAKNTAINFNADFQYFTKMKQTQLRIIFLNMFRNSFDAIKSRTKKDSSHKGLIQIRLKALPAKDPQNSSHYQIIYEDNGTGIANNEINNIFLPFYTKKQKTGTNMGLGLAITYQTIIEAKGTITAENVQTGGLRFIITLPYIIKNPITSETDHEKT